MAFDQVVRKIDELTDEAVRFLMEICSIPALGPENEGQGEMAKYKIVKDAVLRLKPDRIEEVHAPDNRVPDGVRPNLMAVFEGKDTSRTLWILSHIDVVPPGERALWAGDPFEPYTKDGFVYGRGVEDNGQALVASLFAAEAVREICGPAINVGLAMVSDEESGSRYGLEYVLNKRPDLFRPDDLILVPDAGNPEGDAVEIAEKHLLHMRFVIRGKQAHGSRPDIAKNTLRAAAHMIVHVDEALHRRFDQTNAFFNPPVSTFEPTRKDANVPNINTIPGEDVFYFDCRILPEVNPQDVIDEMKDRAAEIDSQLGVQTTVEEFLRNDSPIATKPDAPVVIALAQAILEVYAVQARPHGIGGQTVATFFRRRGLNAAVWQRIIRMAHEPNERISIENLIGDTKVFARMMI